MEIFFRKIWMALFLSVLSAAAYAGGPGMSVLGREDRGPYDCLLVEYDVPGSGKLRSFLLLPDGASAQEPCPGLVLLHDHGARFDIGKEKLARPMASAPLNIRRSALQWVRDNFDGVFLADSLAGLGYAVIVPDMLYWGGRSTGLARRLVPRPYCFLNGKSDRLFPEEAVREAFARMQDIYMEAGAGGRLETAFFDGGHHCGKLVQGQVVDFLEKTVPLRRRICSHGEEDGMGPAEEEACGTHP